MADKTISELPAATEINPADLFVLQQQATNSARSLQGQVLVAWLTNYADGHGGIQGIAKTSTSGLVDTYTISYADGSTGTFTVTNGARGATGAAAYVWIKWAAQNPTADNQMSNNPDNWIGIYSGTASTAPTTYTSYKWFQYKGEKGDTGDTGASILSVTRTSGDGSPGTYDTYTVTLDTGAVAGTFQVWNGLNGTGAVNSVNSILPDTNGNVQISATDVGAVPTGQGIPAGGTTGQVLAKTGSANYATEWVDKSWKLAGSTTSSTGYVTYPAEAEEIYVQTNMTGGTGVAGAFVVAAIQDRTALLLGGYYYASSDTGIVNVNHDATNRTIQSRNAKYGSTGTFDSLSVYWR